MLSKFKLKSDKNRIPPKKRQKSKLQKTNAKKTMGAFEKKKTGNNRRINKLRKNVKNKKVKN